MRQTLPRALQPRRTPRVPRAIGAVSALATLLASALTVVVLIGAALIGAAPAAAQGSRDAALARAEARELLADGAADEAAAEEALALVEDVLDRDPDDAEAFLLRSTARFILGDLDGGAADLDRALDLDPTLRRGWLNRAGLDIAQGRYEAAVDALERARELDPSNPDTLLNIGAVRLLQGDLDRAATRFEAFLEASGATPEAHYLVATNYAGRGYAELALGHLRQAVAGDERQRLRARTDPNFVAIAESSAFRRFLDYDPYRPPSTHRVATRTFSAPHDGGEGPLLAATLEALRRIGEPFDARVEVATDWALVWAERFRVKVMDDPTSEDPASPRGRVEVSAPPIAMDRAVWDRQTEELFRTITVLLAERQKAAGQPLPAQPDGGV